MSAAGGQEATALGKLSKSLGQATAEVEGAALQIQARENERQAKLLDSEFSEELRRIGFGDGDQDRGFYATTGNATVNASPDVQKRVRELHRKTLERASTPAIRRLLEPTIGRRLDRELDSVGRYTLGQAQVAADEVSEARLGEFADNAAARFSDPEAVSFAIKGARAEVAQHLEGQDPEVISSRQEEAETAIHSGVIDSFIAAGNVAGARQYWEDNHKRIDGKSQAAIQQRLRAGEERASAKIRNQVADVIDVLQIGRVPPGLAQLQSEADLLGGESGRRQAQLLREATRVQADVRDFNRRTVAQQQKELNGLRAQQTMTPSEARRFQALERSAANNARMLSSGNGLTLALNNGVINSLPPVDFANPESLRDRVALAEVASKAFGVTVSPLQAGEVAALEARIDQASPNTVANILNQLTAGLGRDQLDLLALQLADDNLAVAEAVAQVPDRPELSSRILRGHRLLQDDANKDFRPSKTDRQSVVDTTLADVLLVAPEARASIVAAATAVYAEKRIKTGDTSFDSEAFEAALEEVTGGVVEFNGQEVFPPSPDIDEGEFTDIVRGLSPEQLEERGNGRPVESDGTPIDLAELRRDLRNGEASLVWLRPGEYLVRVGVNFLASDNAADNGVFVLDLRGASAPGPVSGIGESEDLGVPF